MTAVAWLLKCSPTRWDLPRFIADGHRAISSWTIANPGLGYSVGQPVLFWVTGDTGVVPAPGLWGAGVITGLHRTAVGHEDPYWINKAARPTAAKWIPVDISLFDAPVTRDTLAADTRLQDLQILRAPIVGNPQPVTADQLAVIERYLTPTQAQTFGPSATARAIVTDNYRRAQWQVERTSSAGWDITCARDDQILHIAARSAAQAVLGPAELAASEDPRWHLVVVDGHQLTTYDGSEAFQDAEPIAYQFHDPATVK